MQADLEASELQIGGEGITHGLFFKAYMSHDLALVGMGVNVVSRGAGPKGPEGRHNGNGVRLQQVLLRAFPE